MTDHPARLPFARIDFSTLGIGPILNHRGREPLLIVPINAQVIGLANENPELLSAINTMTPVVDGQIVHWAISRRARKLGLVMEKLSGSDLIYHCARAAAAAGETMALIGGTPAANAGAVAALQRDFGVAVVGQSPPLAPLPWPDDWISGIRSFLRQHRPQVVFFAMGAPKQEYLMTALRAELATMNCRLVVACGGTLDFVSGIRKRAPVWVSRMGLEGLYRLLDEPKLFRVKRLWESLVALRHFRS